MQRETDFYTPGEAAKLLGLAEMTVLSLLTSGELEGHQDERARWWIPSSAMDAARRDGRADNVPVLSIEQTVPFAPISSANRTDEPVREEPHQREADTNEDDQKRGARELVELLQELRVVLPGVQVLFAFLLTVPFNQRFTELTS